MAGILDWLGATPETISPGGRAIPGVNRLGIIGATLTDAALAARGRHGGAVDDYTGRGMMMGRQQMALDQEAKRREFGAKLTAALGADPNNPNVAAARQVLMEGMAAGVDISPFVEGMKATQPTYETVDPTKDRYRREPLTGALTLDKKGTTPFKMPQTRSYERGSETITEEFDPVTGMFKPLATAPRYKPAAAGGGGDPAGKTITERMQNVLLNGDPASAEYAAAYSYMSKPRMTIDTNTGQPVTINSDLSWARPPVRNGQPTATPQPTVNVGEPVLPAQMTQEMKNAAGFADRMESSGKILTDSKGVLADPSDRAKDSIPLGNYLVSQGFQSANQAKRDWINAQLRRESGAVISPEEFANADKQYFPVPGDSDETIAQKTRNRAVAEQAMRRSGTPLRAPVTSSASRLPTSPTSLPQNLAPAGRVIKYDAQGNRL